MKKLNRKQGITALCVIVPIATVCAFIPKLLKERNQRKYTTELS